MMVAKHAAFGLAGISLALLVTCGFLSLELSEARLEAERALRNMAEVRQDAERKAKEVSEEHRRREGEVGGALMTLAQARASDMRELDEARADLQRRWPTGRVRQLAPAPAPRNGDVPEVSGATGDDARTCEARLAGARESYGRIAAEFGTVVERTRGLAESGIAGAVIEAELREARGALRACQALTGAGEPPKAPGSPGSPG